MLIFRQVGWPSSPDHRRPASNKRPLKIMEWLQNKRHDVAYFLVYQCIGEACSSMQLIFEITYTFSDVS